MRVALAGSVLTFVALGCSSGPPRAPLGLDAGPPSVCADEHAPVLRCAGEIAYDCDGVRATPVSVTDCAARGEVCVSTVGCRPCRARSVRCDGETIELCREDGSGYDRRETCDAAAGLRCSEDGCLDLCARAAADHSYEGCEYWPVTLRNSELQAGFEFAVAVANPQLVPAVVHVDGGRLVVPIDRTVMPGELAVIVLPWNGELRGESGDAEASVLSVGGAFHLVSDVPVIVSQFDPLAFQLPSGCRERECFSFTNDASLLLPSHVLTGSYVAVSRPTAVLGVDGMVDSTPGFLAIVGTEPDTVVTVLASAPTEASTDGTVTALTPGTAATFTLDAGDVLQLLSSAPPTCPPTRSETVRGTTLDYCDPGSAWDLTGTEIRANAPLAVYAGHDCTFVPFDRWACDHLEEQMFPVESLGRDLFVPGSHPIRAGEPNLLRVVSAADGNVVRFEPPIDGVPETTLDRGEALEVELRSPVWVRGTGPLLGAVFLVGQDYGGIGTAGNYAVGDPAMALVVPSAQYRDRYTILAPDSYTESWIDLAIPVGSAVAIDGTLARATEVPGTGMAVAHVEVRSGVHRVEGDMPFGLYVSGLAAYTSYYVPGGMDFEPITPPF